MSLEDGCHCTVISFAIKITCQHFGNMKKEGVIEGKYTKGSRKMEINKCYHLKKKDRIIV